MVGNKEEIRNLEKNFQHDYEIYQDIIVKYKQQLEVCKEKLNEDLAELAEVKAAILDGSLEIFDCATWTVNGEPCTSYLANVVPDDAFAPDTEVIIDGAFKESADGFRSAPYFDLRIDGITLLDEQY